MTKIQGVRTKRLRQLRFTRSRTVTWGIADLGEESLERPAALRASEAAAA